MRLNLLVVVTVLVTACALPRAPSGPVTSVSLRTSASARLQRLSTAQVASFNELWAARTEVPVAFADTQGTAIKLSIGYSGRGTIWLYKSSGYATVLTMGRTPVYKLADVEAFNKLIAAAQ
jgi:hypothetical protein